jgi:hypothetical protein
MVFSGYMSSTMSVPGRAQQMSTSPLDLVDQHGALLAAMAACVALPVAVDVEPPDHRRAVHRLFPYPGVNGLTVPGHALGIPTFTDSSTGTRESRAPAGAVAAA